MAIEDLVHRFRESANSSLSQYEPIALVVSPILALTAARFLHSLLCVIQERGIKASIVGFTMGFIKLIPGVSGYIESEKKKVVEKLQSGNKSKRDDWMNELPSVGLGRGVIEKLEDLKSKDVAWQGKCSGTVYVGSIDRFQHKHFQGSIVIVFAINSFILSLSLILFVMSSAAILVERSVTATFP